MGNAKKQDPFIKNNTMNFRFHQGYFLLTLLLFIVEILIALYVRDAIVRPYGGDFLVVILLYFFVKTFLEIADWKAALGVLLFAYLVEILQHFQSVKTLGLQGNHLAEIVIGTGFSWWDMIAYTAGILVIWGIEKSRQKPTLA